MLATSIFASRAKEIDILYEAAVHEVTHGRTTYWTSFQLKADRRSAKKDHLGQEIQTVVERRSSGFPAQSASE